MKKCFLMVLAACAFALTACEDEQSSYSLSDCKNTATLTGNVVVDLGASKTGNVITEGNQVVAAGAQVVATVDYASNYMNSTTAKGEKQFTATTDANGNYSISIPVGIKPITVKKLDVILPSGTTYTYGKIVDNDVVNVTSTAYSAVANTSRTSTSKVAAISVEPNKSYVNDIKITSDYKEDNNAITKGFKVSGVAKIEYAAWKSTSVSEGLSATTSKVAPAGVQVKITVSNTGDTERKLTYLATVSGDKGEYSADVKIYTVWDFSKTKVEVETVPFYANADNKFSEFRFNNLYHSSDAPTEAKTQKLSGVYGKASSSKTLSGSIVSETGIVFAAVTMKFTPDAWQTINGLTLKNYYDGDTKRTYTQDKTYSTTEWTEANSQVNRDNQY